MLPPGSLRRVPRNSRGFRFVAGMATVIGVVLCLALTQLADEPPGAFRLEKSDLLRDSLDEPARSQLARGQNTALTEQPKERAAKYPPLKSARPLYGDMRLATDPLHQDSGIHIFLVVDESQGTGTGYDRLYLDANCDGDLTNDPVVLPLPDPPPTVSPQWSVKTRVVFAAVDLTLDLGAELGKTPVPVVPRLDIQEYEGQEYPSLSLVSRVAWRGPIQIGPVNYQAVLGQQYVISGRFDLPHTALLLTRTDRQSMSFGWWGEEELGAMRLVDGSWYRVSATPCGDRITVQPYTGELGLLQVAAGGRDVKELTVTGSLRSEETTLPVGSLDEKSSGLKPSGECRLPVGDYQPSYLVVQFGKLQIQLSENYHSDGHARDRQGRPWFRGIKIRQDQPFRLDFTNKPEVMFASPVRDATYHPGDEINVQAILIDPTLDIMIRGLNDTANTQSVKMDVGGDRTTTYNQPTSLDPVVSILNAKGKVIAEGKMPFG